MNDTRVRVTIDMDIDAEKLSETDLDAKTILDSLTLYDDDVIDGFALTTNVPGHNPSFDFFLCNDKLVSCITIADAEGKE